MTMHRASCQCGSLTLECQGEPDFVIVCGCRACQKRTGAPFGTGAYFHKDTIRVEGASKGWKRKADSGREIETFFCPECGSTVFWTLEMRPNHLGAAYGCFDTRLPDPARVIWTEQAHSWVLFPVDLPRFEKGIPEPQPGR